MLVGCLLWLSATGAMAQFWMQFGSGSTIDEGLAVDADAAGNVYATGYFTSTVTFGASSAVTAGVDDIFLVKTNAAGLVQWLKRAGGTGSDKGYAVASSSGGNVVVTGYFNGSAQFDTQTLISSGQQDAFVALYNAAGYRDRAAAEYEQFLAKKPDYPEKEKLQKYIRENKKLIHP